MTKTGDNDDVWADGGLAVRESESFSGLKRTTLYELMASGRLAWSKVGARRVISRVSLRRLLEGGAREQRESPYA